MFNLKCMHNIQDQNKDNSQNGIKIENYSYDDSHLDDNKDNPNKTIIKKQSFLCVPNIKEAKKKIIDIKNQKIKKKYYKIWCFILGMFSGVGTYYAYNTYIQKKEYLIVE